LSGTTSGTGETSAEFGKTRGAISVAAPMDDVVLVAAEADKCGKLRSGPYNLNGTQKYRPTSRDWPT
jgi:hypothetical protein